MNLFKSADSTMNALVYKGKYSMKLEEVEKPHIEYNTDAIVRITSSAICGSDLHMYEGRSNVEQGKIFGHEILGVIEELGEAVTQLKVGDRVVLPFNIACGCCFNCCQGFTNACLTTNPDGVGAAYGFAGMGPFQGGQTEFVRVPFAQFNCLKLPGKVGDAFEDDFVLLADVFPTAFHATQLAHVEIGSSVAIYGAGPVGLLTALCCNLRGAAQVFIVDTHSDRLKMASHFDAIPINSNDGSSVEQIQEIRKTNRLISQPMRPGEEKMKGVMCGIDAVGYQCCSESHPEKEAPTEIINNLAELVNPTGHIGIIGVVSPSDPGGLDMHAKEGKFIIPWGQLWEKGITIGTGQCPVKKYNYQLRDLIIAGKAKPGRIVSHRIPLEEASEAYEKFDMRETGFTKVVIRPDHEL